MDITNKVVVISGGCSGLGLATAKYCIANNAKVALIDIDADKLHEVSNKIGALAVVADVAKSSAVESALQVISNAYGDIHVVVNCAGIAPAKRMVGRNGPMPLDVFANVININLLGTFNVMRVFSHKMSTQNVIENSNGSDCERGVIINTASVAAYDGQIGQAAYSASKGGIVAMTLPLARELAQFGIRVMTIAPGIMATPMVETMPDDVQESLAATVTFPKRLGNPSEYASLVGHIVSNSYLNGSVIRLDGSLRMLAK